MNDKEPEATEIKATSVKVGGPTCIGCQYHEAALMVSFGDKSGKITDVFLDLETADMLRAQLRARVALDEVSR